ncbi:MAG: SpoVG family protein [Planctomycetota bacterium]|jgi:stage V sporulation protein G
MEVTEVRVKLADSRSEKLRAYATVTLDGCFVVRDLKIISGTSGLFVAMPSRKLTARCQRCRCKNHLRAQFCNECGTKLRVQRAQTDDRGRAKLHADIAHPINQACRDMIESSVLREVEGEIARSREAGYKPHKESYLDAGPEGWDADALPSASRPRGVAIVSDASQSAGRRDDAELDNGIFS